MKKVKFSSGSKVFIATVCFLLFFSLIVITNTMSYANDLNSVSEYCNMVNAGYWPEFNKSIDCEGR